MVDCLEIMLVDLLNMVVMVCLKDDSEGDDFEPADGDLDDDDDDEEEAVESEEGTLHSSQFFLVYMSLICTL